MLFYTGGGVFLAAKEKYTRQEIVSAGIELIRHRGEAALNARALAEVLGCSTQPIFRNFTDMQVLRESLLAEAHDRYLRFSADYMAVSGDPPYKASGMAYIAFATAEPQLFRLLFMRSRSNQKAGPEMGDWEPTLAAVERYTGLPREKAELFHLEMWAFVHGIAVMEATGYLDLGVETVSRMLTDAYRGITRRWEEQHERD